MNLSRRSARATLPLLGLMMTTYTRRCWCGGGPAASGECLLLHEHT
jgi:hypothetical protein